MSCERKIKQHKRRRLRVLNSPGVFAAFVAHGRCDYARTLKIDKVLRVAAHVSPLTVDAACRSYLTAPVRCEGLRGFA